MPDALQSVALFGHRRYLWLGFTVGITGLGYAVIELVQLW